MILNDFKSNKPNLKNSQSKTNHTHRYSTINKRVHEKPNIT
jgi:hypothetical protein